MAAMEGDAFRLAGAGLPAFLGGFALIAIYAGLMEIIRTPPASGPSFEPLLLLTNFAILLLTGARTPVGIGKLADPWRFAVAAPADGAGRCRCTDGSRGFVSG